MISWRSIFLQTGLPLTIVVSLSACGSSNSTVPVNKANEQMATTVTGDSGAISSGLSAAAEDFEALTEQAFTASPEKLNALFKKTQGSVTGITGQLSPETSKAVDARLKEAEAAIAARSPADIALSAVEGYKLVVSSFPDDAKIPVAVSLLDYAGFRIQADLRSKPKRWDDAREAAKFARARWDHVKINVTDDKLNKRFTASLDELDKYLSVKNEEMAAKSAIKELDLVDELENFFTLA